MIHLPGVIHLLVDDSSSALFWRTLISLQISNVILLGRAVGRAGVALLFFLSSCCVLSG